jgi:biotin synthase
VNITDQNFYSELSSLSLQRELIPFDTCIDILNHPSLELLPLLNAAFEVRKKYFGKEVAVHIINNAQNGYCPEDCHYCAQAKSSQADIVEYPMKSDDEILKEAKDAYDAGAFRYCMVFAGRGPSQRRVEHLARLIREIKNKYPLEVCVSAGLLDESKARILKDAGLDRMNHNLNTSERHYPNICSTHSYNDRLNTLRSARQVGLEVCSGIIVGMGEDAHDIIQMALELRNLHARSIPINFLMPIPGNVISKNPGLTPQNCLRVLCLFRFLNSDAEIRVAAGREGHLRSLESLSLYPANSLFLDGYLNTRGNSRKKTLRMVLDAGFTIKSDKTVQELLEREGESFNQFDFSDKASYMKDIGELRPTIPTKL